MNIKTLHFAALLAISAAFLSCSTTDATDPDVTGIGNPRCKIAAKQGYKEEPDGLERFEGYKGLDELDPICKSEEREFFWVYDTNTVNPPDLDKIGGDPESCIGMYMEEAWACFDSIQDKRYEYWEQWRSEHQKRDLPIPCVSVEGVNMWGAWLTDEEVAELEEVYSVYIQGLVEPWIENVGGNSGDGAPPPTTAIGGCGK